MVLAPVFAAIAWARGDSHSLATSALRAGGLYLFVLAIIRLAGKRTLAELTTFDLVVILMLSQAIEPALVGNDHSLANAAVIVTTLVAMDALLSVIKHRSSAASRWIDDVPTVLIRNGVIDEDAMSRWRVGVDDVMEAARRQLGVAELAQVRFAILERAGGISIIPWAPAVRSPGA
jgi:uncharacterized membrane protein YcaP (DUF421 family)